MSGVATLKVRGAKRHFDEMAVDLPVQPQACSPGRYPLRPPPLKRGRCTPSSVTTPIRPSKHLHYVSASQSQTNSPCSSPAINNNSAMQKDKTSDLSSYSSSSSSPTATTAAAAAAAAVSGESTKDESSAPNSQQACVVSAEELAALTRHLPRRLKRVVERLASGDVSSSERLFTLADLREIVTSVLAEHEAKLREQFTVMMNERLAEQFRDFTKFNEDYVARQLRGTDFAYLS